MDIEMQEIGYERLLNKPWNVVDLQAYKFSKFVDTLIEAEVEIESPEEMLEVYKIYQRAIVFFGVAL